MPGGLKIRYPIGIGFRRRDQIARLRIWGAAVWRDSPGYPYRSDLMVEFDHEMRESPSLKLARVRVDQLRARRQCAFRRDRTCQIRKRSMLMKKPDMMKSPESMKKNL